MIKLKNAAQMEGIRRSCKLLAQVYEDIKKAVEPGVQTRDLDSFARELIKKGGGVPAFLDYSGYPAALCTSVNQAVIHGIPNRYKLKEGDIISLDLGIDLDGYISDSAVTLPVGKVSSEARRLLKVTEESLYLGIRQAVTGNRIKDISRAVYNHAHAHGYGVVREYCGHGVGLAVHEEPQIPNYVGHGPNPRIRPGMVLAIEPMINQGGDAVHILEDDWTVETRDGKLSAHFEHTVAIFEDHTEILTRLD